MRVGDGGSVADGVGVWVGGDVGVGVAVATVGEAVIVGSWVEGDAVAGCGAAQAVRTARVRMGITGWTFNRVILFCEMVILAAGSS